MKTIITIQEGITSLELIPENEFEQMFINSFNTDNQSSFRKESRNTKTVFYSETFDKKLVIDFRSKG